MSDDLETGDVGNKTLSALDFLSLADRKRTQYVDLSEAGVSGGLWVKELTEGEKTQLFRMGGTVRMKGGTTMINASDIPQGASLETLKYGLVTDQSGQTRMWDVWIEQADGRHPRAKAEATMERLRELPSSVVELLVKEIRLLSGLEVPEDAEQKKDAF